MEYYRGLAANKSRPAKAALGVMQLAIDEYIRSTLYFKSIGAQTPSHEYGGSRSTAYIGVLSAAQTLPGLLEARREFKAMHQSEVATEAYDDERGGLLRIAGYRLRNVPVVGQALESKVRTDDIAMAAAKFNYPYHHNTSSE